MEDWALIRRLFVSEKLPKAEIARQLDVSRNTVAKAIASADPPSYSRPQVVTSFEPFEGQVRQLLVGTPTMPASVLAERVGWTGSSSWFRQNVATIRPDYAPVDPADRIVYHPGDQVQFGSAPGDRCSCSSPVQPCQLQSQVSPADAGDGGSPDPGVGTGFQQVPW